jgi:hypothetical protein
MARGGHKLPEVTLGPAIPYLFMPCGRFRDGYPKGWQPGAVFYPLGHPMPYASASGEEKEAETKAIVGARNFPRLSTLVTMKLQPC